MERMREEELLKILQENKVSLMEKSGTIVFVLDLQGQIKYVSNRINDVLLYSSDQLIGKNIYRFIELHSSENLKNLLKSGLNEEVKIDSLALFCTKCLNHYFDGIIFPVKNGDKNQIILYLHDITERKLREDRLDKINEDLESFASKVSHDLKAPLRSIEGLIGLIHEDDRDKDLYIDLMRKSLSNLNTYIAKVADYSRRGVESEISNIEVEGLVEEIRSNFQFIPDAKQISFRRNFKIDYPVYSDHLRLQMILNNLISNAIKYHYLNQEDPFVEVEFKSNENEIIIIVRDNGIGIKEDKLSSIFEEFHRASNQAEGTGIGLFIVKKAIDKLAGTITVKSEVNRGTQFTVKLPNYLPTQEKLLLEASGDN